MNLSSRKLKQEGSHNHNYRASFVATDANILDVVSLYDIDKQHAIYA